MPHRGKVYLCGVSLVALLGVCWAFTTFPTAEVAWLPFAVMCLLATITQFYEAQHGRQSYYPHLVFFFASVLLLQPPLFFLVIAVPHAVETLWRQLTNTARTRAWYIQPFNIITHLICGIGAKQLLVFLGGDPATPQSLATIIAVVLAGLLYVGLNHLLVGYALLFARGISFSDSGILSPDSLVPDLVMVLLGGVVALLWYINPAWIALALAPLTLMYQALLVPQLKQLAQLDSKTGLANARHFEALFAAELARAQELRQPLAFIVADLDYLRAINNTYGHLAGDVVLAGIGTIIRDIIRAEDVAGRFGGEEFTLALPRTNLDRACVLAERLRSAVEAAPFHVGTSPTPIHATISIGVACYPQDGTSRQELFAAADAAVYAAKHRGRNRVVSAIDLHDLEPAQQVEAPPPGASDGVSGEHAHVPSQPARPAMRVEQTSAPDERLEGKAVRPLKQDARGAPTGNAGQAQAHAHSAPARQQHPQALFWLLVSTVIASGVGLSFLSLLLAPPTDLPLMVVLTLLALLAEALQINMYGKNTVSVSVAVAFAATLLLGLPGIMVVSAGIVIAHALKRKPPLYRAAYNWATHVLAGTLPAVMFQLLGRPLHLDTLPLLLAPVAVAALGYYLVDTGLIACAISLASGEKTLATWKAQFQWLFVHYLSLCGLGLFIAVAYVTLGFVGIAICLLPLFLARYAQQQYVAHTQESMAKLQQMNVELQEANRSIQELSDELFETLARFFDARDPYVGSHAATVGEYATALGEELGLTGERLKQLRQAAFLHDIGKIAIPEQILHKPSKLTDAEYELMKTHTTLGAKLLEQSHALAHLAPFVRYHHERWDGRGYPEGLRGEDIPLESRILNVCDSVEAMASDRPYHSGMSVQSVIAEVKRCSGTQFDPQVVEAFLRVIEREREEFIINSAKSIIGQQSDIERLLHREPVVRLRQNWV